MSEIKYWQCGNKFFDLEEFVDDNVGKALKEYIEEGDLWLEWWDEEDELTLAFHTGPNLEFSQKRTLRSALLELLHDHAGKGEEEDLLRISPESHKIDLLQELLRAYKKWEDRRHSSSTTA